MPLSEIRSYLDRRSPEKLLALLDREQAALTQKLARLGRIRRLIGRRRARSCLPPRRGATSPTAMPAALTPCGRGTAACLPGPMKTPCAWVPGYWRTCCWTSCAVRDTISIY